MLSVLSLPGSQGLKFRFLTIASPTVGQVSNQVIGMAKFNAIAYIQEKGYSYLISSENGEVYFGVGDFDPNRVRLTINAQIITGAGIG
jgi:hypothetical protein